MRSFALCASKRIEATTTLSCVHDHELWIMDYSCNPLDIMLRHRRARFVGIVGRKAATVQIAAMMARTPTSLRHNGVAAARPSTIGRATIERVGSFPVVLKYSYAPPEEIFYVCSALAGDLALHRIGIAPRITFSEMIKRAERRCTQGSKVPCLASMVTT